MQFRSDFNFSEQKKHTKEEKNQQCSQYFAWDFNENGLTRKYLEKYDFHDTNKNIVKYAYVKLIG